MFCGVGLNTRSLDFGAVVSNTPNKPIASPCAVSLLPRSRTQPSRRNNSRPNGTDDAVAAGEWRRDSARHPLNRRVGFTVILLPERLQTKKRLLNAQFARRARRNRRRRRQTHECKRMVVPNPAAELQSVGTTRACVSLGASGVPACSMVGARESVATGSRFWNSRSISPNKTIASSECPPNSKKSSRIPISATCKTSCQTRCRRRSMSSRGAVETVTGCTLPRRRWQCAAVHFSPGRLRRAPRAKQTPQESYVQASVLAGMRAALASQSLHPYREQHTQPVAHRRTMLSARQQLHRVRQHVGAGFASISPGSTRIPAQFDLEVLASEILDSPIRQIARAVAAFV